MLSKRCFFVQLSKRRKTDMEKKPYYITTAIAYASGKPHIGNTYEIILADCIANWSTGIQ